LTFKWSPDALTVAHDIVLPQFDLIESTTERCDRAYFSSKLLPFFIWVTNYFLFYLLLLFTSFWKFVFYT